MANDKLSNEINEYDFISNEFLTDVKGEQPVSSSMFEKIFLPSNRIPKSLLEEIANSPETAEKMMTTEIPLFQTFIEKPYWKNTKKNERGFERLNVDIYGAVCLADDRHLLDVIIAHGSMIKDAEKYTLRQVAEGFSIKDVAWEYCNSGIIDRPLINRGVYFHITFKDICTGMNLKNQKKTRDKILERLRRLSIMQLQLTPVLSEEALHERRIAISLIDKEFHTLLDKSKISNRNFNESTYTDLIVNISSYYVATLNNDGIISRIRLKKHYVHLVGKNNIEDFYKTIDMHKRNYIHGKYLSDLLEQYIENKMSLFGINKSFKLKQLFEQIILDKQKFRDHFSIILQEVNRKNKINKHVDYKLLHIDSLNKNKLGHGGE